MPTARASNRGHSAGPSRRMQEASPRRHASERHASDGSRSLARSPSRGILRTSSPGAERRVDALMDTLVSDERAWAGAELREEARGLDQQQQQWRRRASPGRGHEAERREADFRTARKERAARDALAQTAAEEELQTERIRRHAAEKRADALARELAEVRGQLVLSQTRAQGTVPIPVAALAAEARGVAQMGEEIAGLQSALASTQSECAAAMAAMTAEVTLVYALVDEIRQRNDDTSVSVALMTRAMTVYAGLEKTAAMERGLGGAAPLDDRI